VLDLSGGQVVHAVAGRRSEYRPAESAICGDARPTSVARALVQLGFKEVYVADLDAIAGAEPAWETLRQLADFGVGLWLDAGLSDLQRARQVLTFSHQSDCRLALIAGLESAAGPKFLKQLLQLAGTERLVFSLDLKNGRPVTRVPEWRDTSADHVARLAIDIGIRRVIVLDLARVGVGEGTGTATLCRRIREFDPSCQLVAGGGIRGLADLRELAAAGCDGALVATALHDGRLTQADIQTTRRI
jgi:phosphoribosylformimino-5-aminoimidazole carboxamide ribotide isomerase